MSNSHQGRLEYLDSLRGIASIAVVLSHFVLAYRLDLKFKLINYSPFHFFYDGFAAVTLFFILSGYVLTLLLVKKPGMTLKVFYVKRIFRIYPAYLVTLVISFVLYSFVRVPITNPQASSWISEFWSKGLSPKGICQQALFLKPNAGQAELIPQNWSLQIEMLYSFLMPFLFFLTKNKGQLYLLAFNLVLYVFFKAPVFVFHFSLGIFLALNQTTILEQFNAIKSKYRVGLILFSAFLYTYRYTLPMYYYYIFRTQSAVLGNDDLIWILTGLGAFMIMIYCISSSTLRKVLNSKLLVFIGKISYSIYLIHLAILITIIPFIIYQLNQLGVTNDAVLLSVSLLLLFLLTFGTSYILMIVVELPFAKLGNQLLEKRHLVNKFYISYFK